ncbi:hypothetical protein [Rhodococcus sp. NPDC049939]|uniref:hypothetical protein n=1 Tax=Rhodococcus sp. NPDC049939 TaxID=3155511 RepID=UPI0033E14A62
MPDINPAASEENFERLKQDPDFEVAVALVADYLDGAFSDPDRSEKEEWTLSCLPSTNKTSGRERLFTLNVGPMQVLYMERFTENAESEVLFTLYVSASALEQEAGSSLEELAERYPSLEFQRTSLSSADGDGAVIHCLWDGESLEQFVDLPLEGSIRPLADRLVGKGRGPYGQYHNRRFAQHVLDTMKEAA